LIRLTALGNVSFSKKFIEACVHSAAGPSSQDVSGSYDAKAKAGEVLQFWFGPMDDSTILNREKEPFSTYFMRWYGKRPDIDAQIRSQFEADLLRISSDGRSFDEHLRQWSEHPQGLLALTILLDQLPRNMYRDTAKMYEWDILGLLVSERGRAAMNVDALPLAHQMFLAVPLMHVENLPLQQRMLVYFEHFVELAKTRSPNNVGFYGFALDFAKRHVNAVAKYGRFPHRNAILGRPTTEEEKEFLKSADAHF
jgi:uncharacterized protein (DUF924 family)